MKEGWRMIFERDVEAALVKGVSAVGGLCIKLGQDGYPDRLVVLPHHGKTVWVELKRYDGAESEIQKWRHKQLKRIGAEVVVPKSKEEVQELIEKWMKEGNNDVENC